MFGASEVKKLVLISATSTPVTETREEAIEVVETVETAKVGKDGEESNDEYLNLIQVLCIRYSITFWKKSVSVSVLFNSGSEVNAIHPTLARELELFIRLTDVGAQKIDGTMLDTFGIIVTAFLVMNKANRVRFFEKTFLVANVSLEIVLGMLFFTLSGVDVNFLGWELRWKTYTTEKALPTIRTRRASGEEIVCSCSTWSGTQDLYKLRHVPQFYPG